jgi:hypothetical protein
VSASASPQNERLIVIGVLIFVFTAGIPGLFVSGFHRGPDWEMSTYATIAAVGGAVGGALMGRGHWLAGLLGGAVAGPCGLYAVAWWVTGRESVHNVELVLVQLVGSLPGLALYGGVRALGGLSGGGRRRRPEEMPDDDYAERFGDRRPREERGPDRSTDIER